MPENILNENRRSSEANEMLTRTPGWLMRWGMLSIVMTLAVMFCIASLIKYPDTIEGQANITTDPLPIRMKTITSGRIQTLFINDGQAVIKGQPIAEVENNTGYDLILKLKTIADSTKQYLNRDDTEGLNGLTLHPLLNLGEAQSFYNILLQNLSAYLLIHKAQIYSKRTDNLKQQNNRYQSVGHVSDEETKLIDEELKQAELRFKANEKLYNDKVISRMEFYEEAGKLRQHKLALEAQKKNTVQNKIALADNNKQLIDLQYEQREKTQTQLITIEESIRNLENFIQTWQRQFLLAAPFYGIVSYLRPLQLNETVSSGDELFTIIPTTYHNIAYVNLAPGGLGKVQCGQNVHLLMDKYPYQEFGYLEGKVVSISKVPMSINSKDVKDMLYRVKVEIADSLITSYHKTLPFTPEMTATARIITNDRNLLQRLISVIRPNS